MSVLVLQVSVCGYVFIIFDKVTLDLSSDEPLRTISGAGEAAVAQVVPRREGDAANKEAQRSRKGTQAEWPNTKGRLGRIPKEEKERSSV